MKGQFSTGLLQVKAQGYIPVIPDIKCFSPKEGDLLLGRDPVAFAENLKRYGAPALSVVTEQEHFGGSMRLLEQVVQKTGLPVLRKDFIQSIDDLKATKSCGAAAILLMCAVLPKSLLTQLYNEALQMGLEPLIETHTREEMLLANELGATLVGINNRNIQELEKDDGTVSATALLAGYAPHDALLISESAIHSPKEARQAIASGAHAVLVGTAIWKAQDTELFYKALCCGSGENQNAKDPS